MKRVGDVMLTMVMKYSEEGVLNIGRQVVFSVEGACSGRSQ